MSETIKALVNKLVLDESIIKFHLKGGADYCIVTSKCKDGTVVTLRFECISDEMIPFDYRNVKRSEYPKIILILRNADFTQQEIAKFLGISQASVSLILRKL